MALTPRQFLVREVSEKIADLLQDRERAITLEQYQTHTRWIHDELDRIAVPTPHELEVNREPWLRIIEQLISEIKTFEIDNRARFGLIKGSQVLFINPHLTMATMSRSRWMVENWDDLPVRSGAALKRQLMEAGVVLLGTNGEPTYFGKDIAVRVSKLAKLGVSETTMRKIQTVDA